MAMLTIENVRGKTLDLSAIIKAFNFSYFNDKSDNSKRVAFDI